jgi:hypothetical protein
MCRYTFPRSRTVGAVAIASSHRAATECVFTWYLWILTEIWEQHPSKELMLSIWFAGTDCGCDG